MTATAATGGMQWQQGDVRVTLDVAPAEVTTALSRLWQRLLDSVDALAEDDFERPTRCSEWTVVDLVNHLADTASWGIEIITAGQEGRVSHLFDGFEPRGVPKRLTDAADRTPTVARRRMLENTARLREMVSGLDPVAAMDLPVSTPVGDQPSMAGLLHYFWDCWLHERDLLLPLGRPVPELADEVRLALVYILRLEGYVHSLFKREVSVALELSGAWAETLLFTVDAGQIRAQAAAGGETARYTLRGDSATVVDALSGRGEMQAALQGDAEGRDSVSAIRAVLAGS